MRDEGSCSLLLGGIVKYFIDVKYTIDKEKLQIILVYAVALIFILYLQRLVLDLADNIITVKATRHVSKDPCKDCEEKNNHHIPVEKPDDIPNE
jgi:hypothetical protein